MVYPKFTELPSNLIWTGEHWVNKIARPQATRPPRSSAISGSDTVPAVQGALRDELDYVIDRVVTGTPIRVQQA